MLNIEKEIEHLFLSCMMGCDRIVFAEAVVVAKIVTTTLHGKSLKVFRRYKRRM